EGVEQPLGNAVVANLGVPLTSVVSTTQVNGQGDALALDALETGVVDTNRFVQRGFGIDAHLVLDVAPPCRIDVVGVAGRVDLNVLDALADERPDFRAHDGNEIPQELRIGGISAIADALLLVNSRDVIGVVR